MTFKGKIDIWWYVVIGVLNGITIGTSIYAGVSKILPYILVLLIVDLYFIPPVLRNEVTVDKKSVTVRFGFLKKELPVKEITTIRIMKSYGASFAASFQRVGIESQRKTTVFIALTDNKAFVNELLKMNKKIKYVI
ncbi:MAG: PH domain-containing protein [Dorea sp.]|uniref:PH domain-containing protein n=1 Tax=Dorea sp. YH-dor226 TaxID=3151119 RepID=UPI0030332BD0|nr:PH domain-containing protein [Dorea sp.]